MSKLDSFGLAIALCASGCAQKEQPLSTRKPVEITALQSQDSAIVAGQTECASKYQKCIGSADIGLSKAACDRGMEARACDKLMPGVSAACQSLSKREYANKSSSWAEASLDCREDLKTCVEGIVQ